MKTGKWGLLLMSLALLPFVLKAQQKKVTVTITQQTDRGTVVIDTTFAIDNEVDLDAVLESLEAENQVGQSIVIRGNSQGMSMGSDTRMGVVKPVNAHGKLMLGVYIDTDTQLDRGVRISSVVKGGAAQRAGMKDGDILVGIGNKRINSYQDVVNAKKGLSTNRPVELYYTSPRPKFASSKPTQNGKVLLGVYLDDDADVDRGIRISRVTDGGAADRAGIEDGDVLLRIGDTWVNSEHDVVQAKKELSVEDPVEILFVRGSRRMNTVLSFIEGGGSYSYNYDYDYDYDYDNDYEDRDAERDEERDEQNHNQNWNWDQNQNWNWNANEDNSRGAFLGVYTENMTEGLAEELDLRDAYGVYVDDIVEGSAAEAAGLEEGDVIVGLDDEDIPSPDALSDYLEQKDPGERLRIAYYRDGRLRRTVATLGSNQRQDNSWQPSGRRVQENQAYMGVYLEDARNGVRISSVVNNSAADDANLRRGDVITELDGQDIDNYDDLKRVMKSLRPGENVRIRYRRNGDEERTRITMGSKSVDRWVKP
jgi:S1-C subfamily serine protease